MQKALDNDWFNEKIKLIESFYRNNEIDEAEKIISTLEIEHDLVYNLDEIFKLIEKNPEVDFWLPWDLIRLLESYSEKWYEKWLLISIKRQPCFYNLWMLQRLINSESWKGQNYYKNFLRDILQSNNLSLELKEMCEYFLED